MIVTEFSEADADRHLQRLMAEIRASVTQIEYQQHWEVHPGSAMAADDVRTNPYHLSHAARSLLGSAIDHLHAIANLIDQARVMHPWAHFTLARGTLEIASIAVWLLAPDSSDERVLRRLRLAVKDSNDGYVVSDELGGKRNRTKQEQHERFKEIAAAARLDPAAIDKRLTSTEMVKAAEAATSRAHALAAWRAGSGIAHGRTWANMSLLEREVVERDDEAGIGTFKLTTNTRYLTWVIDAGFKVTKRAAHLYLERAANSAARRASMRLSSPWIMTSGAAMPSNLLGHCPRVPRGATSAWPWS